MSDPVSGAFFSGPPPVAWGRSRPGSEPKSLLLKRPTTVSSAGPTAVPVNRSLVRRTAAANVVATISRSFGKEVPMPLIKPRTRGKQFVRHRTRLDRENTETLYAYARFLGESTEYVLNQVIDTVLAKDKEFVQWRADSSRVACSAASGATSGRKGGQRRPDVPPTASADARVSCVDKLTVTVHRN